MSQAGEGFPKTARLLTAAQFEYVFENPRVSADGCFTVLMRPNGVGRARLGLAISKRRVNKASGRNRIKRLVRESFRLQCGQLPAADFVVMARTAAATAGGKELWKSLESHWQRLIAESRRF